MVTSKKAPVKAAPAKPDAVTVKPVEKKAAAKPVVKVASAKPAAKPAAPKVAKPAAAVKPAVEAVDVAAKPKAAPKKTAAKSPVGNSVPADQRAHYIEIAAFYIAERRGFAPGNPLEDWVAAEAEIDRLLAEGRLG